MSSIRTKNIKDILVKENRSRKRAPYWVIIRTNRKVRGSPKSNRHWRRNKIF